MIPKVRKHYTQVPGHIPEEVIEKLRELSKGKKCLQIGAGLGKETIILAQVAESVDVLIEEKSKECEANLFGYDNVTYVVGDISSRLSNLKNNHFDFALVLGPKYMYSLFELGEKLKSKDAFYIMEAEND